MLSCRSCNTLLDFQFATGKMPGTTAGAATAGATAKPKATSLAYAKDDPPDVEQLGRSLWTLLHLIAANYPEEPTTKQQRDLLLFLGLFSGLYPCWWCGEDFEKYMDAKPPQVKTQDEFGHWLCEAHNEVNTKLGKPKFDCDLWKKRWKDGWDE